MTKVHAKDTYLTVWRNEKMHNTDSRLLTGSSREKRLSTRLSAELDLDYQLAARGKRQLATERR